MNCRQNYTECLEHLNKLDLNAAPCVNSKIENNRAVAEFYRNGFRKHADFSQRMNQLLPKVNFINIYYWLLRKYDL